MNNEHYYKSIEETIPALLDFQNSLFDKFDKNNYDLIENQLFEIREKLKELNAKFTELSNNQCKLHLENNEVKDE